MENMEKEVKIARVLITISVIFGLFAVMTLLAIGIGSLAGRTGIPGTLLAGALLLAAVKTAGTGFGLAAYLTITRGDLRMAGGLRHRVQGPGLCPERRSRQRRPAPFPARVSIIYKYCVGDGASHEA